MLLLCVSDHACACGACGYVPPVIDQYSMLTCLQVFGPDGPSADCGAPKQGATDRPKVRYQSSLLAAVSERLVSIIGGLFRLMQLHYNSRACGPLASHICQLSDQPVQHLLMRSSQPFSVLGHMACMLRRPRL